MAKKIRFSLEMENGRKIRTLDELRENFSLTKLCDSIWRLMLNSFCMGMLADRKSMRGIGGIQR